MYEDSKNKGLLACLLKCMVHVILLSFNVMLKCRGLLQLLHVVVIGNLISIIPQ